MKKFFSFVLALVLAFSLSVPAFAATGDITLTYDLKSDGKNDIVVQTGDVITVAYSLSASEKTNVSVTQNEIYYDDNFFDIVEGSNKGSAGFTDYTTTLQKRLDDNYYVYFNTIVSHTHDTMPSEIGTFQLKVIATEGETTISNVNYKAFDINAQAYGAAIQDLHVSIGAPQTQKFTLTFNNGDGTVYKTFDVVSGKDITIPAGPDKSGYTFSHWSVGGNSTQYTPGMSYTPTSDVTFTPNWTQNGGGGGGGGGGGATTTSYLITASAGAGGSISPAGNVSVNKGADKTFAIKADSGYAIADVLVDGKSVGAVGSYTFKNVTEKHTITASFQKTAAVADPETTGVAQWLNTTDHMKYLNGYGAGIFAPQKNMTRAEVAQMFYNLLLEKNVTPVYSFADVPETAWYADAVNALASLGIVKGTSDTSFTPNRSITRAEFTVIAMRFAEVTAGGTNPFSDVSESDWYYDYVIGAVQYGWINGYEDGTFHPNAPITRAEVTAVVNRMLGRAVDKNFIASHETELTQFSDVSKTFWGYGDIMEATNTHTYSKDSGAEAWVSLD